MNALLALTSGHENVAVGVKAGDNLTTGFSNIYIGDNAGNTHATGNACVYVGRACDCSANNVTQENIFGDGLGGKGNNTTFLAGTNGTFNEANQSSFQTTSDERIKKNITDNTTGLDKINQVRIRNFEYRASNEIDYSEFAEGANAKSIPVNIEGVQLGVIAQEIEQIFPEVVNTQSTGVKTVHPDNLTWYIINAIKELSAEVNALKAA